MTRFKKCDVKKCGFTPNLVLHIKCHDCHTRKTINVCSICRDYYGIQLMSKMESFFAGQGTNHSIITNFSMYKDKVMQFWSDTETKP
jgi:hypothetical protein